MEALREATLEELSETPGMSRAAAEAVVAWLRQGKEEG